MSYPSTEIAVINYLNEHPVLDVRFPEVVLQYTFTGYDGIAPRFKTNIGNTVVVPLTHSSGETTFNEDGFERNFGNHKVVYYYCGPTPWKSNKKKSAKQQRMELWDEIYKNIKIAFRMRAV